MRKETKERIRGILKGIVCWPNDPASKKQIRQALSQIVEAVEGRERTYEDIVKEAADKKLDKQIPS